MNSEKEKIQKLALTMASEWNDWPCLFAMSIGQMFLLNSYAHNIIIFFVLAEIAWFFVAEKFVNYTLALQFHKLCKLCWVSSLLMSIILFMHGRIMTSVIALTWVFILMVISFLVYFALSFIMKPLGISPPRIEIIELKMKAAIMNFSQEETRECVAIASELMDRLDE